MRGNESAPLTRSKAENRGEQEPGGSFSRSFAAGPTRDVAPKGKGDWNHEDWRPLPQRQPACTGLPNDQARGRCWNRGEATEWTRRRAPAVATPVTHAGQTSVVEVGDERWRALEVNHA